MPNRNRNRARDRGSATIYAALLAGLLTTLTGAALALGAAILARHRAGSAADLAALSAAVHAEAGQTPCDWARRVAAAQRARLLRCACEGPVCLTAASIGTPWGAATVTSRAGPADDPVGRDVVAIDRRGPEPNAIRQHATRIAPAGFLLGLDNADIDRSHPLAGHFPTRPLSTGPCPPTRCAPLVPTIPPAPTAAVLLRLKLTEPEPLARSPTSPRRQLRTALPGAVYPHTQQP